jgi:hypothetical protein
VRFRELIAYQRNFYHVVERARNDADFYRRIWLDPLRVLSTEGIREQDAVDFLRQIQAEGLATDAGWGTMPYPISIQDMKDSPLGNDGRG